jgi:hypothetical protein
MIGEAFARVREIERELERFFTEMPDTHDPAVVRATMEKFIALNIARITNISRAIPPRTRITIAELLRDAADAVDGGSKRGAVE